MLKLGCGACSTSSVLQGAWDRGQAVAVHGLVYSPADGSLKVWRAPAPADAQRIITACIWHVLTCCSVLCVCC